MMSRFSISIAVAMLVGCTAKREAAVVQTVFPEGSWETSSPEAMGINRQTLDRALAYLDSCSFDDGIEEVVVVRHGRVIHTGDSVDKKHNIYSCSKAFTSTVLGLLQQRQVLTLEDRVSRTLPELTDQYPDVQWKHFATMTSGYSAAGRSRWEDENADWSWTPYTPEAPHFAPGTHFEYWDEAQMMFGKAVTTVLGESMYDYLDRTVMQPIGITDWSWGTEGSIGDSIPINNGCTGVHINAMELAKFGLLFLNDGKWKGEQILDEGWCRAALSSQVPASIPVFAGDRFFLKGSGSYGYNWWVNSADGLSNMPDAPRQAAYLSGLNHNICMVIPEWDMVFVRLGDDRNPAMPKHIVWNNVLKILGEGVDL